ncbi:MAG: aminotransferase class V-fold PLP-dependent enzyme [Oscillospiraceae bacterium]|nr:aminotransferase class V-fold PLP-dependent enzyme [Oscillospiraceae bacterium]
MIYLDNAATSLRRPQEVIDAVVRAMTSEGNAARGAHGAALSASRTVYNARVKLAGLLGCPRADHVIFTSNATESLNIALFGTLSAGDHVISTDLEHNSVLRPLYALNEERGVELSFVPADDRGCIDYKDIERLIKSNTRAIVCTHASNLTGNRLDMPRIGAIAKKNGLMFIADASQTAGCTEILMQEWGIDILCFTGHKGLMGPQGTGGMCIREGMDIRPWKRGGSGVSSYDVRQPDAYPTRLEAGTLNIHGIAGLSAAVDYIQSIGTDAVEAKENALMRRFYQGVAQIDGVTVYGDFEQEKRAPIVALNIRDYDSGAVADELFQYYGIATRSGAHCAPRMHRALGTEKQGAVRFSFGWFNTTEETDLAIEAVRRIAE